MLLAILSVTALILALGYESNYVNNDKQYQDIQKNHSPYLVSLITLKNSANAPFYYHTALELRKKDNSTAPSSLNAHKYTENLDDTKIFTYGLYPDYRSHNSSWLTSFTPIKQIFKFLRPIFQMQGRIRSPDILYQGSDEYGIQHGNVVYREIYPVTEEEWNNIKYDLDNFSDWTKNNKRVVEKVAGKFNYNYMGIGGSNNCASWVKNILNKYFNVNMSCQLLRFKLFGFNFAFPISFVDFPLLCSTSPKTHKMLLSPF